MKKNTKVIAVILMITTSLFVFQACQENSPWEDTENIKNPTEAKQATSSAQKSRLDYGTLHNCGLAFVMAEHPMNPNVAPDYTVLIPETIDFMEASCSMPRFSSAQRDYLVQMIEDSPLKTVYPGEFITPFIDFAIDRAPESAELLNTYKTLWQMLGSGESQDAIDAFYSDEILNGNWSKNDAMIVARAEQVRVGSLEYWTNHGTPPVFLPGVAIADMIGTGVCGALAGAASFGAGAPLGAAVGGLIVSAGAEGLIENWGNW